MNLFFENVLKIWAVPNGRIVYPGYIEAHAYGVIYDEDGKCALPSASILTLEAAVAIAKDFPDAKLIIPNNAYFWPGSEEEEWKLKEEIFLKVKININRIIRIPVVSTIDEVMKGGKIIQEAGSEEELVVIFDRIHARSGMQIWHKLFPAHDVVLLNISGQWNDKMLSWFQRTQVRWLICNMIRMVLFGILGKKIRYLKHRIKRKE